MLLSLSWPESMRGQAMITCSRPIRSWMRLWLRPMRQKMQPKMMAEDTLLMARAKFVALSLLICRLPSTQHGLLKSLDTALWDIPRALHMGCSSGQWARQGLKDTMSA